MKVKTVVKVLEIKVRIAQKNDGKNLYLIDKVWKKEAISPGFIPRTKQRFADAIEKDIVVVAEKKNKIIGYALGSIKKSVKQHVDIDQDVIHMNEFGKDKTYIDIDSLYVLKKYRSKGIGKILMKKLIKEVKRRGIRRVLLASDNKKNPEKLISFYKSLGFEIVVTYFMKKIQR